MRELRHRLVTYMQVYARGAAVFQMALNNQIYHSYIKKLVSGKEKHLSIRFMSLYRARICKLDQFTEKLNYHQSGFLKNLSYKMMLEITFL